METKRVILARFVDFYVTPTNVLYHGNRMSDFPQKLFFVEQFLENQFCQLFASILHFLPFS